VLPITVVAIVFRSAMASERNRKEIVLAALEKNPDIDVELLMKNLKKSEKLIKEKLLANLQHGSLCCLMGVAFVLLYFFLSMQKEILIIAGTVLIAIGIAFLVSYFVGRRMLEKEMEAEEQNMNKE
jgi:putative Mn2+ efflux pump MntP